MGEGCTTGTGTSQVRGLSPCGAHLLPFPLLLQLEASLDSDFTSRRRPLNPKGVSSLGPGHGLLELFGELLNRGIFALQELCTTRTYNTRSTFKSEERTGQILLCCGQLAPSLYWCTTVLQLFCLWRVRSPSCLQVKMDHRLMNNFKYKAPVTPNVRRCLFKFRRGRIRTH